MVELARKDAQFISISKDAPECIYHTDHNSKIVCDNYTITFYINRWLSRAFIIFYYKNETVAGFVHQKCVISPPFLPYRKCQEWDSKCTDWSKRIITRSPGFRPHSDYIPGSTSTKNPTCASVVSLFQPCAEIWNPVHMRSGSQELFPEYHHFSWGWFPGTVLNSLFTNH